MFNSANEIKQIFLKFFKQYRKYMPPFMTQPQFVEPFVLGSFFSVYEQTENILKLRPKFYLNKKTGWILRIMDVRGFRKSKYFYVGYFPNKRQGKRYVFGLLPNKKVVLCAIATHVSANPANQKHNSTKAALTKAKGIMRPIVQEALKNHQSMLIFDIARIDKYLFKFTSKKKIRRFKPNWLRIYQIAATTHVYWKGT